MGRRCAKIVLAALLGLTMASCSVTRFTPKDKYVLMSTTVAQDKNAPKKERITESDVERYIQQNPAKRFLGTNLTVGLYNMVDPESKTWWARLWRGMGTPPVIFDTASMNVSTEYIGRYVRSRGYFDGTAGYAVDTAKQKAKVTYTIRQGEPYRIGKISYDFKDRLLEPIVMRDSTKTLLHTGAPFDSGVLDRERTRIKDYLHDHGYYTFSVNNIRYRADSTVGDRRVDVTVEVRQFLSDYDEEGAPILDNNAVYRLLSVNVYPDYDATRAATDSTYMHHPDTMEYRGMNIIYGHKLRVKKEVLHHLITLQPNQIYSAAEESKTYGNLMRLGYYRSARIVFTEAPDSTRSFVTFIGANGVDEQVPERYLICNIYCTPSLRQGYNLGLEGTFTSDYFGISATVGYRNRSLFRGVEQFDLNFTGSYDFMRVKGKRAAFEFGGNTSITFPRFLFPFRIRAMERVGSPRSKLELSINAQRRPYYSRVLSSAGWGYSWAGNRYTSFTVKPIDVGLVKMNYIDSTFLKNLQNQYLINSYRSQLIAGISGSFVYNNPMRNLRGNGLNFRLNAETSGNLLDGICSMFGSPRSGEDYYRILGIQFAQYARADMAVTNNIPVGEKMNLVWRFYAGGGISYGNSRSTSIPYDRLFYAGGSNSMRGWAARTLGPGGELKPDSVLYPSQLGNMRLELNLEARFPLWSILRGAVFFDTGNVWYIGQGDYSPDAVFNGKTFYKQLGFNTGVGLRVDISMLVVRADWGIRLHDPNMPPGERWIHNFRLGNTALSIAVGYPF